MPPTPPHMRCTEPSAAGGWLARRLSRRIVAVFLGLLLVVQAFSFVATRLSIERNSRSTIDQELQIGERVVLRLLAQNGQKLSDGARLLAADYGFRAAASAYDERMAESVLTNHGDRTGASTALLLDTHFALRASAFDGGEALLPAVRRLSGRVTEDPTRTATEVVAHEGRAYQMVMVPVRAPVVIGWVVMAVPLDLRLLHDMRDVSGLHLSLSVRGSGDDTPWARAGSTLPAEDAAMPAKWPVPGPLRLGGQEFGSRTVVLDAADGGNVQVVLMRSLNDAVAPYRDLQWVLVLLTLGAVVLFAVGSVVTARRITTPVQALVRAAERLAQGDYRTPVDVRSADEIGELASAFDRMRKSIDAQKREIARLAYWDALTDLPNRAQFRDAVHSAIAQARPGTSFAVLLLDLDRFKHVNDVLGYQMGDRLLREVAQRLLATRETSPEFVARLGGDDFALLLHGVGPVEALSAAERIARAFDESLLIEGQSIDMGASIGITLFPQHAPDADALVSRAEVAVYTAKRRGAGVMLYDDSIDSGNSATLTLLGDLRQAVEREELRLYLQPKVSLATGEVVGAEALVRWQHPQRGLVPPMQFIPFAEQTSFIRTLTGWVMRESLRTLKQLHAQGRLLTLSVNLSTRDLTDPQLPARFAALLKEHRVAARFVCLEITESAIMDDPQRAQATLEGLSALGFPIAIDDFGTGYSSLAYLKRLPVDELKIDRSFVMQMTRDSDDAKIVRSTIDLAHNLGLAVVAEGVESGSSWRMLRSLGCDQAQGYLIGRPMPVGDFPGWAREWEDEGSPALQQAASTFFGN